MLVRDIVSQQTLNLHDVTPHQSNIRYVTSQQTVIFMASHSSKQHISCRDIPAEINLHDATSHQTVKFMASHPSLQ